MNGQTSRPVLRMLESDVAGLCDPDSGACAVPDAEQPDFTGVATPVPVLDGGNEAGQARSG